MNSIFFMLIFLIFILSPLEVFFNIFALGTLSKYLGFLLFGLFIIKLFVNNKKIPLFSSFLILIVFLFYSAISIIWSSYPMISLNRVITLLQLIGLFYITSITFNNTKNKEKFLKYISLLGFGYALYIIYQVTLIGSINEWTRVSISSEVDVNHIAAFLIIPLFSSLYLALNEKKAYLVITISSLVAITFTQSRGAIIASLFGFIAYLVFIIKPAKEKIKYLIFLTIIVITILNIVPNEFFYRIAQFFTDFDRLSTGSARNIIWSWAYNEFLNSPIFGMGIGNFSEAYRPAHSSFFQVLADQGLIGVLLWGLILYSLISHNIKNIYVVIFFGLFIMSLTVDIYYQKYVWIIFGILASFQNKNKFSEIRKIE